MKKSVISFIAVMLVIVLLGLCAVMGFTVAGRTIIPAVNDTEHGIRLGLDLVGGSRIVYEAELPEGYDAGNLSRDMETAQSMIRQRLTNKGFTEATVALSGDNRISVEIPQITNPEEAVQTLGSTAQLVFMDADGKEWLTGTDIKRATAMYGQPTGAELTDEHYVQIEFTDEGTQKFSEATASIAARKNTDGMNFLAIVMDNQAISTPMVENQLTQSTCVISGGNFTAESAKELADLLKANGLAERVYLDFSVEGDMGYYSGIVFRGFLKNLSAGVLSGGQYDKMVEKMGKPCGAMGFAIYLNELERLGPAQPPFDAEVLVLYDEATDLKDLTARLAALAGQGKRVLARRQAGGALRARETMDLRGGRPT